MQWYALVVYYRDVITRNTLLKVVSEACGLRVCDPMPHKVCFHYHLKRCSGPCEHLITSGEYTEAIERASGFLSAPHLHLIGYLTQQMQTAADLMEFERAAHIRDQIQVMQSIFERQVVERDIDHDQEVLFRQSGKALRMRLQRGALIEIEWLPSGAEDLLFFYASHPLPPEIILNTLPEMPTLTALIQQSVRITVPQLGLAFDLLEIARLNYEYRASLHAVLKGGAA